MRVLNPPLAIWVHFAASALFGLAQVSQASAQTAQESTKALASTNHALPNINDVGGIGLTRYLSAPILGLDADLAIAPAHVVSPTMRSDPPRASARFPIVRREHAPRGKVFTIAALPGDGMINLLEGLAVDRAGNLFVAELAGRIIKITPAGAWSVFAEFDLGQDKAVSRHIVGLAVDEKDTLHVAMNTHNAAGSPAHGVWRVTSAGVKELIAAVPDDRGNVNQIALDRKGNIYASDSTLGVIWRIAPGQKMATLWFEDRRILPASRVGNLCGVPDRITWGANGIAFDRDGALLVSSGGQGLVLRIPIDKNSGNPLTPEEYVRDCNRLVGMDQIAIDVHGGIYIARNLYNEVVRVRTDKTIEILASRADGIDVPANISFGPGNATFGSAETRRRYLYITNLRGRSVQAIDVGVEGLTLP